MNELKNCESPPKINRVIIICLVGFFLSVVAYFFTDSDTIRGPLPLLGGMFVIYGIVHMVYVRIDLFGRECIRWWFCVPFLLMDFVFAVRCAIPAILMLPYELPISGILLAFLRWVILNIGIIIYGDILLIIQVNRIAYAQKEKMEFTQREGILLGIYYLLRIYQMVAEIFWLVDMSSDKFCPNSFIYMPLILCIWMSVRGCVRMFKESREFKRFLTIITLPMLIILLIGICYYSSFLIMGGEKIITIRYEHKEIDMKAVNRYLYTVMDMLFLLFSGAGMVIGMYAKKIAKIFPPVRSMLVIGAAMYIIYSFTLPEYWIMKSYWEKSTNTPSHIMNADVGPIVIGLVEDEEWSLVLEFLEKSATEDVLNCSCDFHFKYYWIVNQCNIKPKKWYEYNYSYYRTKKMLEEKLAEAKQMQEKKQ